MQPAQEQGGSQMCVGRGQQIFLERVRLRTSLLYFKLLSLCVRACMHAGMCVCV